MKVELIYFRPMGKYYSSGELEIDDNSEFYSTIRNIRTMLGNGENPGLIKGTVLEGRYDTLVKCDGAFSGDGWPPYLITFNSL